MRSSRSSRESLLMPFFVILAGASPSCPTSTTASLVPAASSFPPWRRAWSTRKARTLPSARRASSGFAERCLVVLLLLVTTLMEWRAEHHAEVPREREGDQGDHPRRGVAQDGCVSLVLRVEERADAVLVGDVCVRSESGHYTIVERVKELIKYSGTFLPSALRSHRADSFALRVPSPSRRVRSLVLPSKDSDSPPAQTRSCPPHLPLRSRLRRHRRLGRRARNRASSRLRSVLSLPLPITPLSP